MFAGISKYILIILILLGQGSVLAHELDLDAHQSNDTCTVCLLHSALDDTQVSASLCLWNSATHSQAPSILSLSLPHTAVSHSQARAPPQLTTV
jgi:hypothetical protein